MMVIFHVHPRRHDRPVQFPSCNSIFSFAEHYPAQENVVSSELSNPFLLPLNYDDQEICFQYRNRLKHFGIDFEFPKNNTKEDESNSSSDWSQQNSLLDENDLDYIMRITHVPLCFILREQNEAKHNRTFSLMNITIILIKEVVENILKTRGCGLGILPKTISDVLNSRACRGMLYLMYIYTLKLPGTCFMHP